MNTKESRKVMEMIESEEFDSLNDKEKISALVSKMNLRVNSDPVYSFDASWVNRSTMPKEMSDWLEEQVDYGNYIGVKHDAGGMSQKGYVMKSGDCAVVLFPHWNCNTQIKELVNLFRDNY